jgi:hypothetical protein
MHMTAIHAQPEQNGRKALPAAMKNTTVKPDHGGFALSFALFQAACATADTGPGEKRLSSGRIQAIFMSNGTPLGECRVKI